MIQKNRDSGGAGPGWRPEPRWASQHDESIMVLIDEAHGPHNRRFGREPARGAANAAWVGFTGTPIMTKKRQRKTSEELFGTSSTPTA